MNRSYKTVYNRTRGLWQVVSELAKSQGKSSRTASRRCMPCVEESIPRERGGLRTAAGAGLAAGLLLALPAWATDTLTVSLGSGGPFRFWDGSHMTADNAVYDGGSGTWNTTNTNWTNLAADENSNYDPNAQLIFAGQAGTVTIDAGGVNIGAGGSLQFNADGYMVQGGALTLTGATPFVVNSSVGATIASNLIGGGGLEKTGSGTLTLSGQSNYGGDTTVDGGTLAITSGGTLSDNYGRIGRNLGKTGVVTVDGVGSTWNNSGFLAVGDAGSGTLNITGGGKVSNGVGLIGYSTGEGAVTVEGTSSTWANNSDLYVGYEGSGTLEITKGGRVTSFRGFIGQNPDSKGFVTVDGHGSTWANSDVLAIGLQGEGALQIRDGGVVSNINGSIGEGATGSVTVDGTGSTWMNNGALVVGKYLSGTLEIKNGGQVSATNDVTVGNVGSNTGAVFIGAASGAPTAAGVLVTPSITLANADHSFLFFNHTDSNYDFDPQILGAGRVIVQSGVTRLTQVNSYTGATFITGGTLKAGTDNAFSANSFTTVNAGGTLDLGRLFIQQIDAGVMLSGGALQNGTLTQTRVQTTAGTRSSASDVVLTNSSNVNNGAAISNAGSLTLTDANLSGNTAQIGSGGAIENLANATLDLTNVTFDNNHANSDGGAIHAAGTNSVITGDRVTFTRNTAGANSKGGALDILNGDVTLTNSQFGTSATGGNIAFAGGAMYLHSGSAFSGTNLSFIGNTATGNGGAIYNDGAALTLTDTSFTGNSATGFGGAIYVNDGTVNLNVSAGNTASFSGNTGVNRSANSVYLVGGGLNVNVAPGGTLDMADSMTGTALAFGNVNVNSTGAGLWRLGGVSAFNAAGSNAINFNISGGALELTYNAQLSMLGLGGGGGGSTFKVENARLIADGSNAITAPHITFTNADIGFGGNVGNTLALGSAGSAVTFNGSTWDIRTASGNVSDKIAVNGVVSFTSTNTINLLNWNNGTYRLLDQFGPGLGNGFTTLLNNQPLSGRQSATFDYKPTGIQLTLDSGNLGLTWLGNSDNNWSAANWSGGDTNFVNGDGVTFGPATAGTVTVTRDVAAADIVVGANAGDTYTFTGPGSITASTRNTTLTGNDVTGQLRVFGTGNVVFANDATNHFESGIFVNGATLTGNSNTLNTDGNTVLLASNAKLVFDQANAGSYDAQIIGDGSLIKTGAGTLQLTNASTYTGETVIDAGTLTTNVSNAFSAASSKTTVNAGGTLDLGGLVQKLNSVVLSGGAMQNGVLNNSPVRTVAGTKSGVTQVTFASHTQSGNAGAIDNLGDLALASASLIGNRAQVLTSGTGNGGAIENGAGAKLELNNVSFGNNRADGDGGAIQTAGASGTTNSIITGDQVIFTRNTAGTKGGALDILNGDVTLTNSRFGTSVTDGNIATDGGAVYVHSGSKFSGNNLSFTGNHANGGSGGAIFAEGAIGLGSTSGSLVFADNQASGSSLSSGGAIAGRTVVSLTGAQIDLHNNTADQHGGAIYAPGGFTLTHTGAGDAILQNNSATNGTGGAISAVAGVTLSSTGTLRLLGNRAQGLGGAVYSGSSIDITGNLVANDNHSDSAGGALFTFTGGVRQDGGTISMTGNQALNVTAGLGNGGAIAVWGAGQSNLANVNLASTSGNVSFSNNTATSQGGAIWAAGVVSLGNANGSTLLNSNTASSGDGGAIFARNNASGKNAIAITGDLRANNNNSASNGGALFAQSGGIRLDNGDVSMGTDDVTGDAQADGNRATGYGGAIATFGSGGTGNVSLAATAGNVVLANNSAGNDGGAISASGTVHIGNAIGTTLLSGNRAVGGNGGAIRAENNGGAQTALAITGNLTADNNRARSGGVLFADQGDIVQDGGDVLMGLTAGNLAAGGSGGAIGSAIPGKVSLAATAGEVNLSNNHAMLNGGAIFAKDVTIGHDGGVITLANNSANGGLNTLLGGAIYAIDNVTLTGALTATGNSAGGSANGLGGAIYAGGDVTLNAAGGDMLFSGNTQTVAGDAQSNAIYLWNTGGSKTLTLNAQAGHSITFRDAIQSNSSSGLLTVKATGGGNVAFDGAASSSFVYANTSVENGATFAVRGATYGLRTTPAPGGPVATSFTVQNGGTLTGGTNGTIVANAITIASGGTLKGTAGDSLALRGDVTLAAGSHVDATLGAAPTNLAGTELFSVDGNLTSNGSTIDVHDAGGFGTGLYRIISYSGNLTAGSTFNANDLTTGGYALSVQSGDAHYIDLLVSTPGSGGPFIFWDGQNTTSQNDGQWHGGNGNWSTTNTNWANVEKDQNGAYDPSAQLIFAGQAGTVTVDAGGVNIGAGGSLQFVANGYIVNGGALTLTADTPITVNSGLVASIDSAINGNGGLIKQGAGTLTLGGVNGYTGATDIKAGTLALTNSLTTLASSSGVNVALGATFDLSGAGDQAIQSLSGSGEVKLGNAPLSVTNARGVFGGRITDSGNGRLQISNGTQTLTGSGNNYQWTDVFQGGTLRIADGGTVTNNFGVIGNNVSGNGTVVVEDAGSTWNVDNIFIGGGAGVGTLSIANGGTVFTPNTVAVGLVGSTGVLSIGAAVGQAASAPGTLDAPAVLLGDAYVRSSGTLVFNHTDTSGAYQFTSQINGTGRVNVQSGVTTLTGANSYAGGTNINGGTLRVSANANLGAPLGALGFDGGTLTTTASFSTNRAMTLGAGGGTLDTSAGTALTMGGVIDGSGSLTKTGAGALSLTAANTYAGGTTISSGVLQLDGTNGSIPGNVLNNGGLILNRTNAYTFAGAISGSGGVTQAGGSVTTLTGANSYGGATTISGGTLLGGAASTFSANSATTVNANGSLDLGGLAQTIHSVALAGGTIQNGMLTGAISSSGGFVNHIGGSASLSATSGTTFLTTTNGSNTYTGATTINSGAALGALTANAFSSASLTTVNTGGVLSLGGGVAQAIDTIDLAGGTITSGALTGAVSSTGGVITNVSGTASLTTTAGTTTFNGANGSMGAITVGGGTLRMNQTGVLTAASYTAANSASTAIEGTARLDVTGTFTQASGSTLNVAVGANDPAITAATSSLDGTLNVTGYAGAQFTALHTTGGISGDFVGGLTIGGAKASSVDYMTVNGSKTANGNDYVVNLGLSWNAAPADAHGTFTLANATEAFTISEGLSNRGGISSGWDGKRLTKEGLGTLTLAGNNSYTGPTTINGGTLAIASTGALTSHVTNNATFDNAGTVTGGVTNAAGATFTQTTGSISGGLTNSGTVNANGGALDGAIANNAGGGFTVGGTVTSNSNFDNAHDGTLAVLATGNYTLGGLLTNRGGVTIAAGGTLTAGNITNTANGTVINNGTVNDDLNNAGLYTNNGIQNARVASNTGTLVNSLGATWTGDFTTAGIVNNDGAINGSLTQTAGTTTNNGTITGAVAVSGGLYTGTGALGGITVGSGASFQPGNGTAGTSTKVNGNIVFQPGSTYVLNVGPVTASRVDATGTATLNGGTVRVLAGSGNYAPAATYTILTAAGGRTGAFDGVTSNLAFLTPSLSDDANHVYLKMTRNDIGFANIGGSPNQQAAGMGAESLGFGHPIYDAAIQLAAASALHAFDQLSGELHASAQTAMLEDSRFVREAANDRLRTGACGISAGTTTLAANDASQGANTGCDANQTVTWMRAFGSWGHTASDGNAAKLGRSTGGFFLGVDGPIAGDWRIGALAGISHSNFDAKDRDSSGRSDNYHLGLYASRQWGDLALRSGAAYTWHDISTNRSVKFPGFSDSAKSDYRAGTAQVFGEIGYGFQAGNLRLEPFANLAYVNLHTKSFTEKGGAAALQGKSANTDTAFSTLGLHTTTAFELGGTKAAATATLGWRHAYGDVTPGSKLAIAGGNAFSITGAPIVRNAAVIDAGLDFSVGKNTMLGVSYNGQFGSGAMDNGVRANLNIRF